jgi:hypothetical protein
MRPAALLPLTVALWPTTAPAQDGPSFDCQYAGTRTEIAICSSPELARLEMRMFDAYQGLVERIGQREARRIADELLVRRQGCEGDPDCIAERLLISMEVFDQRGRSSDYVADLEPTVPLPEIEAPAPAPAPEEDVAALEAPNAEPGVPLAAQAPWPPESVPVPPSRDDTAAASDAALAEETVAAADPPVEETVAAAEPSVEEIAPVEQIAPPEDTEVAASPDLSEAIDEVEQASSDGGGEASFDTPLSWAFMDLSREERAALQARLQEAGLYDGPANGTWDNATRTALETTAEEAGTEGFDLSSQNGAALLLDFVSSDAFGSASGDAATVLDDSQF